MFKKLKECITKFFRKIVNFFTKMIETKDEKSEVAMMEQIEKLTHDVKHNKERLDNLSKHLDNKKEKFTEEIIVEKKEEKPKKVKKVKEKSKSKKKK